METAVLLPLFLSLLGLSSMISSSYVCLSIIIAGDAPFCLGNIKSIQKKQHIMMIDVIFWMCITDILHALQLCLNFAPQIFVEAGIWFYDENGIMCNIISVVAIFFAVQSPLWHMLLSYRLLWLLKGYSLESLNKQKIYHYIIALIVRIY